MYRIVVYGGVLVVLIVYARNTVRWRLFTILVASIDGGVAHSRTLYRRALAIPYDVEKYDTVTVIVRQRLL